MSKVYIKFKNDRQLGAIPHNYNFANALYGFRELGADIAPYFSFNELNAVVTSNDIVVDYINSCEAIFQKFNKSYTLENYPKELNKFLGRRVWYDTINSIASDESKWSKGYFVKPVKSKIFTGKTISKLSDLIGCGSCYEDYEVLVSEPINIKAEWRCFILYDEIIDIRPYGMLLDSSRKSYMYHYDSLVVQDMLTEFIGWKDRPFACSMDICVTDDGKTLLVEFNDSYSLGSYGLPSIAYAKMISARWAQIMNREDEFKF